MTQKLEMLKSVLQRVLGEPSQNEWDGSVAYKQALSDAKYATNLSEIALTEWLTQWGGPLKSIEAFCDWYDCLETEEKQYFSGVQFVADEWDKILYEDDEGEGL